MSSRYKLDGTVKGVVCAAEVLAEGAIRVKVMPEGAPVPREFVMSRVEAQCFLKANPVGNSTEFEVVIEVEKKS